MRLEQENDYAKKGVAGTALGLSIGAVAIEALKGGLGNLFTGVGGCGEGHGVSQREAMLSAQIILQDYLAWEKNQTPRQVFLPYQKA